MNLKHSIHNSIIDTGALLIALTLNYSAMEGITDNDILRKVHSGVRGMESISPKQFSSFFSQISQIETTTHVLGELNGLVNSRLKFDGEKSKKFWNHSFYYLKKKNLNENLISYIELIENNKYKTLADSIGFVDTGLLKLGIDKQIPIITTDYKTLSDKAYQSRIKVVHLQSDIFNYA